MASDERYQCCPFARSGGFHGEDCTYSGNSHCPFRLAAEGLHVVTAAEKAVLAACLDLGDTQVLWYQNSGAFRHICRAIMKLRGLTNERDPK